jgi:hypothetical protein
MPRPSTVDRLPPEIREAIGRLREHGKTIDEILDHLRGMEVDISRSALGRHVKGMAAMGERLRRSRAMAEGLARQLGETPGDKMARVNIELLHSFLNDTLAEADEEGSAGEAVLRNPKAAAAMASAIEKLTKASRQNQDFVERIEARASEAARRGAAAAAEGAAKEAGLSAATIETITRSILGVRAP